MSLAAEIARHICEDMRNPCTDYDPNSLVMRLQDARRLWPEASAEQLFRAHLVAYELLVLDLSEAISGAAARALPVSLSGQA